MFADVDYCFGSPCVKGGKCVNLDSGFQCNCEEGWTGEHCDGKCTLYTKTHVVIFL